MIARFHPPEATAFSHSLPIFKHLRPTWKDKLKPRLRASEYVKSFFANFRMKTNTDNTGSYSRHRANEYATCSVSDCYTKMDEYIYGRVNVSMDNLGKQNNGFVPLSMLKASLLTLK